MLKNKYLAKCAAVLGLLFAAVLPDRASGQQYWSMGYWEGVGHVPASDIEWPALTHLALVCCWVDSAGTLHLDDSTFDTDAPPLIAAAHAHNVKVLLNVFDGAAGFNSSNWNGAIQNSRSQFIANIMSYVNNYGFDGVDIDWEGNFNEANNSLFIPALRAALGTKLLTEVADQNLATYWGGSIHTYLDRLNCLTYFFGAANNAYSWFTSPLHDNGDGAVWSEDLVRTRMTAAGVPKAQMNFGVGFFGLEYSGGNPTITGPRQTTSGRPSSNEITYVSITNNFNMSLATRDAAAGNVPWIYQGGHYITYDDPASIVDKVSYVKQYGLGGLLNFSLEKDYFPNAPIKMPLLHAIGQAFGFAGSSGGPSISSTSPLSAATVGTMYSLAVNASGSTPMTCVHDGGAPYQAASL